MIRVLVVDDDYHVARVHAKSVATVDGFSVVGEAHTGAAALELIASTTPDLLLLDMYLPDFTGLELVRRISATSEPIPDFLLLTAARDIESVRTAMQLGAFYYLVRAHTRLDSMTLVERLIREHHVAAIPGSAFADAAPCSIRISYGALQAESVAEGLGRLVTGLRALA